MSGDGKRGDGHRPPATAPIFDSTQGNDDLIYFVELRTTSKSMQQHDIPTLYIAEIGEALLKRLPPALAPLGCRRKHMAYSPDLARLLSQRGRGQCQSGTINHGNEIAPSHSITSSASASSVGGMVRFSRWAVFTLMVSS